MMTALLAAALLQLPFAEEYDARSVLVSVELSSGEAVTSRSATQLWATATGKDSLGFESRGPCWQSTQQSDGVLYPARIGGCLEVVAWLPPHPVGVVSVTAHQGLGAQVVILQLAEPAPMRSLVIDLEPSVTFEQWPEYLWEIRLLGTATPFLHGTWSGDPVSLRLPAGLYEFVVDGQSTRLCGNAPPSIGDFMCTITRVDLRAGDQALTVRPARGAELRLYVHGQGPPPDLGKRFRRFVASPAYLGHGDGRVDWVRPRLVSRRTGAEVQPGWGWGSLPGPAAQDGVPTQLGVYAVDRIPAGAYELQLFGHGIQPTRQRFTVRDGDQHFLRIEPTGWR